VLPERPGRRSLKRLDPWPTGRVTLLGDAAHPRPPGGVGANLTFRDARLLSTTLGRVLAGEVDLLPALAACEREMCGYAATAREEALTTLPLPEHTGTANQVG
jgi:2-polyprenyl-6-methoxyphenol hydroxylase-like FAD-dependent oxidoreductase